MKIELEDRTVEYNNSDVVARSILQSLVDWYTKHDAFEGEVMCQSDESQIDAIYELAKIADEIIKFKVEYK